MRPYCWLKIFIRPFCRDFILFGRRFAVLFFPWQHCSCVCVGQSGFTFTFPSIPRQHCFALAVWGSPTFGQVFFSSRGSIAPGPSSALAVWSLLGFSFPQLCSCHCFGSFGVFRGLLWTIFDIFSFGHFPCFYFWQLLSLDVYFWWLMTSLGTLCCSGTIASIFEL